MPKTIEKSVEIYKFLDTKELPAESLTNPDYRLKILQILYGDTNYINCSKCHHCR